MISHVLFVAKGATAEGMARRYLRQQGYTIGEIEPELAFTWTRQHLPDVIVWAGEGPGDREGFRDLRLHPATWNVPIVQLVDTDVAPNGLLVEPDVTLLYPRESELAVALDETVSTRDRRVKEGVRTEVSLQLPSGLDQLESLCLLMTQWCSVCGLKAMQGQQVTIAVRELAANAIEWGHRSDRSQVVRVCSWLEEDRICVLVSDSGPGFDRFDLPHAARHGDSVSHLEVRAARNLREGGFGILMAKGLVDHLCFNEKGNQGLVVKFLPRSAVIGHGERSNSPSVSLAC